MDIFQKIAEEKIRRAMAEGEFDDLPNIGKPLKLGEDSRVPEDLRMTYKILKNADCLPPELELKKEILSLQELIRTVDDEKEKSQKIRQLNYKLLKFNTMRKTPFYIGDFPEYQDKLLKKYGVRY